MEDVSTLGLRGAVTECAVQECTVFTRDLFGAGVLGMGGMAQLRGEVLDQDRCAFQKF